MAAQRRGKKVKAFQNTWLERYGLRLTARCPKTSEALSVVCQLCESYGAEDDNNPDRKRKRTGNVCSFKKPWRIDHMKRHCETFHPSGFAAFCDLKTDQQRIDFFKPCEKYSQMKLFGASPSLQAEPIYCTIGLPIIDVIIAQLLLEPMTEDDESDINFEAKVLSIFHLNNTDTDCPYYSIQISNPLRFLLIVSCVGCGILFRQCFQIILKTRETTGIGNIGNVSKGKGHPICSVFVCEEF